MTTQTKPAHTPTPWKSQTDDTKIYHTFVDESWNKQVPSAFDTIAIGKMNCCDDAAYIVNAVNAHELLVDVVKQAMADAGGDCSCSDHKCLFCFGQEALAKAEGKE